MKHIEFKIDVGMDYEGDIDQREFWLIKQWLQEMMEERCFLLTV